MTPDEVYNNDNLYAFNCEVSGQFERYYVCLKLATNQIKKGEDIRGLCRDGCKEAVDKRTCPALKMRKEELNKGEGIYYMKRPEDSQHNPKVDVLSDSYRRGWLRRSINAVKGLFKSKPQKHIPPKPGILDESGSDGSIYQQAINKE